MVEIWDKENFKRKILEVMTMTWTSAIIFSYLLMGITKVVWLFFNRDVMSPGFIRHPTVSMILLGILYQPIIKINNHLRNFRYGRSSISLLIFALLKLALAMAMISFVLVKIF